MVCKALLYTHTVCSTSQKAYNVHFIITILSVKQPRSETQLFSCSHSKRQSKDSTRLLISTPMLSLYGPPPFKHKVGELILDLLRPREYQSLRLYLFRFRLTGKAWVIDPNRPGFKTRLQHFQVVQIWTSCPTSLYRSPPSWCGTIFPLVTICILKEDSTVFKALSSLVTY